MSSDGVFPEVPLAHGVRVGDSERVATRAKEVETSSEGIPLYFEQCLLGGCECLELLHTPLVGFYATVVDFEMDINFHIFIILLLFLFAYSVLLYYLCRVFSVVAVLSCRLLVRCFFVFGAKVQLFWRTTK